MRNYASISPLALTDPQAALIGILIGMSYHAGDQFAPSKLWPKAGEDHIETLEDYACRSLCFDLHEMGYLGRLNMPGSQPPATPGMPSRRLGWGAEMAKTLEIQTIDETIELIRAADRLGLEWSAERDNRTTKANDDSDAEYVTYKVVLHSGLWA